MPGPFGRFRAAPWMFLALLQSGPALAHGGMKKPAPSSKEQQLGERIAGPFRIGAVFDAGDLEFRVEKRVDPPDPILGAYVPATEVSVGLTLSREGVTLNKPDLHPEGEAGVYLAELGDLPTGGYEATLSISEGTQPPQVATFSFTTAGAEAGMPVGMPHPFLTHMGVPDPPGAASVRVTGIRRAGEVGVGEDASFHIEAGIFDRFGLHLRNDAITGTGVGEPGEPPEDHGTELMLMYTVLRDAASTRGLSIIGEVSAPTVKTEGPDATWAFGVGGEWMLGTRLLFDGVVHVEPDTEEGDAMVEYESTLVLRVGPSRIFALVETRGEFGEGLGQNYLLPAVKVGLGSSAALGVGMQFPLTEAREYDRQAMFQLDMDF